MPGLRNISQEEAAPWADTGVGVGVGVGVGHKERGVQVVITSDSNTVGGMVALINSIISNTETPVFFHLITDQATSKHLQ